MRFSLPMVILSFVVVGSAWAAFGPWGAFFAVGAILVAVRLRLGRLMSSGARLLSWFASCCGSFGCLAGLPAVAQYEHEIVHGYLGMHNLQSIRKAIVNYEKAKGSFPPAYLADANGKPMHSWRALVLRDLDMYTYRQYN